MNWGRPFHGVGAAAHRFWYGTGEKAPWLRRAVAAIFAFLVPIPILLILLFRFVPLPGTPEMLLDLMMLKPVHYAWSGEISPWLGQAVIASEDQRFCSHHGF